MKYNVLSLVFIIFEIAAVVLYATDKVSITGFVIFTILTVVNLTMVQVAKRNASK